MDLENMCDLINSYLSHEQYYKALKVYDTLLDSNDIDETLKHKFLIEVADIFLNMEEDNYAINLYKYLVVNNTEYKYIAAIYLTFLYCKLNDYVNAEIYCTMILDYSKDKELKTDALLRMGYILARQGKEHTAKMYLDDYQKNIDKKFGYNSAKSISSLLCCAHILHENFTSDASFKLIHKVLCRLKKVNNQEVINYAINIMKHYFNIDISIYL
jgi:tetratricopeptide (TPR) repeat protein